MSNIKHAAYVKISEEVGNIDAGDDEYYLDGRVEVWRSGGTGGTM